MRLKNMTGAALLVLLLTSCNNGELSRSQQQRDSLMTALRQKEASLEERETALNEFIESFNEVETNLDCVAVRQRLIYSTTEKSKGEMQGTQREKINAQIHAINDLMESNRKTIADLEKKLKRSGGKNRKLQKTVETLQAQLARKDEELAALNKKLNALNLQVAQLQTSLDSAMANTGRQSRTIEEQITALHTAYYIVGRGKDLRSANIIDKKGGLLGIGRTSKLTQGFDRSKFTRIDYTKNTSIAVNSKQVRVVTHHPADSYKLDKDPSNKGVVKNLVISDPERFWSVSKFLVIEGNPVEVKNEVSAAATGENGSH